MKFTLYRASVTRGHGQHRTPRPAQRIGDESPPPTSLSLSTSCSRTHQFGLVAKVEVDELGQRSVEVDGREQRAGDNGASVWLHSAKHHRRQLKDGLRLSEPTHTPPPPSRQRILKFTFYRASVTIGRGQRRIIGRGTSTACRSQRRVRLATEREAQPETSLAHWTEYGLSRDTTVR